MNIESKAFQANELLNKWNQQKPNDVYLYFEDQEITFKQLLDRVNSTAVKLIDLGIKPGERVALFLFNSPEFIYAWFAINKIGAVMVPINTGFKKNETEFILQNSGCKGIIADELVLDDVVIPASGNSPLIEWIAVRGHSSVTNILSFEDFFSGNNTIETIRWPDENLAAILYTSGTTGKPKGVMCPYSYYSSIAEAASTWLSFKPDDRFLTILPLFHMNAQTTSTMGSLNLGASLILLNGFNPATFWQTMKKYKATIFNYLGLMLPFLVSLPVTAEEKDNPVRYAIGAQADPNQIDALEKRWDLSIIELFGMTEIGGTCNPIEGKKLGSCGLPMTGHTVRIVDENGEQLPTGEIGEITVSGSSITLGYWRNEEETNKTYRDGFVFTGDVGYLDEDGFLFFVGRRKDIIRRSGENIASAEVENVVMAHPKVVEAAALPVPDPVRDEEVKIYVVLKQGETPETLPPEEIVSWCQDQLAKFKIPRYIEYIDQLPKTNTQKVRKIELIEAKTDLTIGAWDRFGNK